MKWNLLLSFASFVILMIGGGCSLPAPAEPTPHSLPATPNFQQMEIIVPPASAPDLEPVSITASAFLPESPPAYAMDGDPETIWNSGGGPEQWILFDMGKPLSLSAIRLFVSQYPEGESVHQIWVGPDTASLFQVYEFASFTKDSDVLEFIPDGPMVNVRFIKILTTQSSSWVAWREIEIHFEVIQ